MNLEIVSSKLVSLGIVYLKLVFLEIASLKFVLLEMVSHEFVSLEIDYDFTPEFIPPKMDLHEFVKTFKICFS